MGVFVIIVVVIVVRCSANPWHIAISQAGAEMGPSTDFGVVEQFVAFYYKTFDENRANLSSLYVCPLVAACAYPAKLTSYLARAIDAHFRATTNWRGCGHCRKTSGKGRCLYGLVHETYLVRICRSNRSYTGPTPSTPNQVVAHQMVRSLCW